jgi:hypothetical protein
VIAPFQLQSTISRIVVVEVPSFVVDDDLFGHLCLQHSTKVPSQLGLRRDMLKRNQDVRRPEVLSFDFTNAASRTYRNVPETIEINCSCRDASSVWRGGIDMVSSAFASCIW